MLSDLCEVEQFLKDVDRQVVALGGEHERKMKQAMRDFLPDELITEADIAEFLQ